MVPDYREKNMQKKKQGTAFLPGYDHPFSFHSGVRSENVYALYIISFLASCSNCMLLLKSKQKS
jgi:hypothetical protein